MFFIYLCYIIVIFFRPQDWVPCLLEIKLLDPIGVAVLLCLFKCFFERRIGQFTVLGQVAILFVSVVILSPLLSFGYIHGTVEPFWTMLPLITIIIAGIKFIQNRKNLRTIIFILVFFSSFISINSILQMSRGIGFLRLIPTGDASCIRVQAFGIFNNPNNLALLHAMVIPLLLGILLWSDLIYRIIALPLLAINFYSLYGTHSRGGQLGAIIGLFAFVLTVCRGSKKIFFGSALCIAFVLLIFPQLKRNSIDTHGESERGRMEAWSEGLTLLKQKPLAGIGYGMWGEYWRIDTHSSYVRSFAETGLLGFYFFIGLMFLGIKDSWRIGGLRPEESDPPETIWYIHLGHCLFAATVAYLGASIFQTRTYYLPTYLYLTMISVMTGAIRKGHETEADQYFFSLRRDWIKTGILTVGSIAGIYLFTKTLWRW